MIPMTNTQSKQLEEGLELLLDYKLELFFDYNRTEMLVPVVVQDNTTLQVLMLAYANQAAFQKTLETGYATFYSRSRDELWTKGETSGNKLLVREILTDCDQDALHLQSRDGERRSLPHTNAGWRSQNIVLLPTAG